MDELVRVGAVLREAGDSDRNGRPDRLARGLDVERALRDGAANPFRDLQCLIGRRLRQEDRELLPAEARRHVVMTELGTEDFCDPLQHGVAREVTVGVVDVAQEVEVGHDQRHRALEAAGAADLLRQRGGEVSRVEEPGLRVDAGLRLQCRNAQGTVDQEQWSKRERYEPGVRLPEGVDRNAQRREHEVGSDVLGVEEPCLTQREPARESQHHCQQDVVDGDEHDADRNPGQREPQRIVGDAGMLEDQPFADEPGRHGRERIVEDVEGLQVPAVAHLQPLRHHLDDRHEDEQLRRQDQRGRNQEDDVGVVRLVGRRADDEQAGDGGCRGKDEEGRPLMRRLEPADERQRDGSGRDCNRGKVDLRIPRQRPVSPLAGLGDERDIAGHSAHALVRCFHRRYSFATLRTGGRSRVAHRGT